MEWNGTVECPPKTLDCSWERDRSNAIKFSAKPLHRVGPMEQVELLQDLLLADQMLVGNFINSRELQESSRFLAAKYSA